MVPLIFCQNWDLFPNPRNFRVWKHRVVMGSHMTCQYIGRYCWCLWMKCSQYKFGSIHGDLHIVQALWRWPAAFLSYPSYLVLIFLCQRYNRLKISFSSSGWPWRFGTRLVDAHFDGIASAITDQGVFTVTKNHSKISSLDHLWHPRIQHLRVTQWTSDEGNVCFFLVGHICWRDWIT